MHEKKVRKRKVGWKRELRSSFVENSTIRWSSQCRTAGSYRWLQQNSEWKLPYRSSNTISRKNCRACILTRWNENVAPSIILRDGVWIFWHFFLIAARHGVVCFFMRTCLPAYLPIPTYLHYSLIEFFSRMLFFFWQTISAPCCLVCCLLFFLCGNKR